MHEQLSALMSAAVGNAFSAGGWLRGSLAGTGLAAAVQQIQRRRAERARDILLDELSRGEKLLSTPELEEARRRAYSAPSNGNWTAEAVRALVDEHARMNAAKRLMMAELVPAPFADVAKLAATKDAIVRTGFFSKTATYGGALYKPTRAFQRLCTLVEAALEVEPA